MAWSSSKITGIQIWTVELIKEIRQHCEIGQNMTLKYATTSNMHYDEKMCNGVKRASFNSNITRLLVLRYITLVSGGNSFNIIGGGAVK